MTPQAPFDRHELAAVGMPSRSKLCELSKKMVAITRPAVERLCPVDMVLRA